MRPFNCQKSKNVECFAINRLTWKDKQEHPWGLAKPKAPASVDTNKTERAPRVQEFREMTRQEIMELMNARKTLSPESLLVKPTTEELRTNAMDHGSTGFILDEDFGENERLLASDSGIGCEEYLTVPGLTFTETQWLKERDKIDSETSAFSLAFYARLYTRILENLASRITQRRAANQLPREEEANMVNASRVAFVRAKDRIARLRLKNPEMFSEVVQKEEVLKRAVEAYRKITTNESMLILEEDTSVTPGSVFGTSNPSEPRQAGTVNHQLIDRDRSTEEPEIPRRRSVPPSEVRKPVKVTRTNPTQALGSLKYANASKTQALGSLDHPSAKKWPPKKKSPKK